MATQVHFYYRSVLKTVIIDGQETAGLHVLSTLPASEQNHYTSTHWLIIITLTPISHGAQQTTPTSDHLSAARIQRKVIFLWPSLNHTQPQPAHTQENEPKPPS